MDLRAREDEAYELVISVADGRIDSVEEIAKELRLWARDR